MIMKLGISSFTYGWAVGVEGHRPAEPMGFMELIERTHEFGLSLLQVGDNLPLDRLPCSELQRGKQALEQYGIELELGIRGLKDSRIRRYLELCRYFSSRLLRVVIDESGYEPTEEEIIRMLKRWAPEFLAEGVTIGIENHERLKARQLAYIICQVDSPSVGICLDTANSLGALEGLDTVAGALIPYTVNLHAKDVSIRRLPSQLGFEITGTVSGEGMLNMVDLIRRVSENGRDVNCILEQWTAYTGDLEKTIQKEALDAVKGVHNLQKIIDHEFMIKSSKGGKK